MVKARIWVLLLLLAGVVAVVAMLLKGHEDRLHDRTEYTRQILNLRNSEILLDRDLLRITAFQLQQYDPLAEDIRHILMISRGVSASTGAAGVADGENGALADWLEALRRKLHLAQQLQSTAAIVRNEIYYLSKAISDYHHEDKAASKRVMDLGYELLQFTLLGSDLQQEDLRAGLARLAAVAGESRELRNIRHHVGATLDYVVRQHELMADYNAIDTQALYNALYLQMDRHNVERLETVARHRQWLAVLAALLLLFLAWTLWVLERERRRSEQSRQRLGDAINSLSEGFALFDGNGRLQVYNPQFVSDYPWVGRFLKSGVDYEFFKALNTKAGVRAVELQGDEGVHADEDQPGSRLEQFQDEQGGERWLLASDVRTRDGERVLVRVDVTEAKQREMELAKLFRAVEQSPVSVVITNSEGEIEYANPRFEQVTGYQADEAIGRNPRFLKSGLTPDEVYQEMWSHLLAGEVWHGELINKRKDGSTYWEEVYIAPVRDHEGTISHYIAFKEDISERRRVEEMMRMQTAVFETLGEGVMIMDPEEHILAVNPAFTRVTGYEAEEVIGKTPRILSSGLQSPEFHQSLWKTLLEEGVWEGEIEDRRKDGTLYPVRMHIAAVKDAQGQVTQYISVFSDISERRSAEERIRYQANYDALTGLPNRHLFLDRVSHALQTAGREGTEVALLFVDLDRFKEVNDSLGHLLGDELLKQVATRLQACVRDSDTISRFGGDEFVLLLEGVGSAENSATVASKVLRAVEQPLQLSGNEILVGASIGITHYPEDAGDAVTLLRNADMAMYRAKEAGRNNYQFYTHEMNEQVMHRIMLAGDLRRALDQRTLFLVYQPIVRIADRSLKGFEALLRWDHPNEGLIAPEVFIPLAEETGLIAPIGEWVLQTAAAQAAQWQAQGRDWRVGINLSSRQLDLGLDVARLRAFIEQAGIDPSLLTLEMTEGLMLDGSDRTRSWLNEVHEMGVCLSIDDFGTGYSSLSYLKRYPMSTLKIDRSFIRDLAIDPNDAALVQATLAMAHSLGLEVVAEGVEDEVQLAFLEQNGCEYAQGWWFGKPMPAEDVPGFLESAGERIRAF